MNLKRFLLALLAVFGFIVIYEWVFHGILLEPLYQSTPTLWRPKAEMGNYFPFLTLGQFFIALFFCLLFLRGYADRGVPEGLKYGLLVGLLFAPSNLIMYAVQPLPPNLILAWILGGLLESLVAGGILATLYRPKNLEAA